jgi:hypothetical protein
LGDFCPEIAMLGLGMDDQDAGLLLPQRYDHDRNLQDGAIRPFQLRGLFQSVGATVYYTAQVGLSTELMQTTLKGVTTQLTHSTTPGTLNYLPTPSPDGEWIMFGSNSSGTRQLCVMPAGDGPAQAITNVPPGSGAMFGMGNPVLVPEPSSYSLLATGGLTAAFLWRLRHCRMQR